MANPISEVFNMDCVEFMKTIPDNFFDLAIADPPYGEANSLSIRGGGRFGGIFARYKSITPLVEGSPDTMFTDRRHVVGQIPTGGGKIEWDVAPKEDFFKELVRVSKEQIIWGANYFPDMPPTRCFIVWKKTNIAEVFSMAMAEYAWTSFSGNAKVFEHSSLRDKHSGKFHPTEKPIALYAWLLKNYAKPGDRIFDPMLGSGSSRIAAYKMGFDFCGCELDKEYFDKGCERFDRECKGEIRTNHGQVIKQYELFNENE